MISLKAIKNNLLKYFNDNEITVYKYYNDQDDLYYVEVFQTKGYSSKLTKFRANYLHEWERHVNMNKYKESILDGVWVSIYEGYEFENMVKISREFYTK